MTDTAEYTPPKVWTWNKESGGRFANINRPIAGPTHDKELPVGKHPFQLYSLATPNGMKVTVMLEELLALGHSGRRVRRLADPHQRRRPVRQRLRGGQPQLQDPGPDGPQRADADPGVRVRRDPAAPGREVRRASCPPSQPARAECLSWLFWLMGSAPYLGGGFGHFYAYAPIEDRIRHRPLRHGGEAPAGRARPAAGARAEYLARRRLHHRRHGDLALVRRAWPRALLYGAGEFLEVQRLQERACAGPTRSPSARR